MGKFSFKCITKDATFNCVLCPGSTSTFVRPPSQNIIEEQNRKLAAEPDTLITPFGICTGTTTACVPSLRPWKIIDKDFKSNLLPILIEKTVSFCQTAPGLITVATTAQDIISIDFAGVILRALQALRDMLDFRIEQFTNDRAAFDACFDHWFGEGHPAVEYQNMYNRLVNVKNHTDTMINNLGTDNEELNENHFEMGDPFRNGGTRYYGVYAYVRPADPNRTIRLTAHFFDTTISDQAATIGHELSHFPALGNTDDEIDPDSGYPAYGGLARHLAQNYPGLALTNAENFTFFLESGAGCP